MKIIKKIEFVDDTLHFFQADCENKGGMTIELCNADIITGKLKAVSELELENTGDSESHIFYRPHVKDSVYDPYHDPDYTPPEVNFRLYPEDKEDPRTGLPREIYDKVFEAFDIPPKTKSISVIIAPGDSVTIYGKMTEKYVIVDDDGNEIPLETLLNDKNIDLEKKIDDLEKKIQQSCQ